MANRQKQQLYLLVEGDAGRAMDRIDFLSRRFSLPSSVRERAGRMCSEVLGRSPKGTHSTVIQVASVYAACRQEGLLVSLNELAAASGGSMTRKDVARSYRQMVSMLELAVPAVDPTVCVGKIGSAAGLTADAQKEAILLISKAEQEGFAVGKNPMALAAAALFVVTTHKTETLRSEIAKAAGVSEVTIRNRSKDLIRTIGTWAQGDHEPSRISQDA